MLELYLTENKDLHGKVEILIERKLGKRFTLERTENGKPYIEGNPFYFSISHSCESAVIALCDKPVGIDLESRNKVKNYSHIIDRFSEREKKEIGSNPSAFLMNWTAKEAYIKMLGGTLAHYLKRLEYCDCKLYCDGKEVECGLAAADCGEGIYSVCAEGYTHEQLKECSIKLL